MSLLLHHRPTYFHFSLLLYYFYWIFLSNSHTPSLISMSHAHFTTGIDVFSTPYRELNLRPPAPKPIAVITTPRCTMWNRSAFFRYDSLLVRGFPRSNVQTYFKRILHEAANAQLWLPLKSLSIKLYLFLLKECRPWTYQSLLGETSTPEKPVRKCQSWSDGCYASGKRWGGGHVEWDKEYSEKKQAK